MRLKSGTFRAEDGKMRLMDVATPEQMFRLIQSIPSPKAEPFKIWMAKVISPLNAADAGALDVDDGPASLAGK